ncbi:SDR family NAD(P)-dependent oxidoreductase [Mesorhizobium sp. M1334]|uniref:SDR family NAD(P)-dependent oxidoreductase n=1 Tax=Mesorhizobium sp. M1334 TaxID=2957084 RepID=UPI0033354330
MGRSLFQPVRGFHARRRQLSLPDMVTTGSGRVAYIGSLAGRSVPRIARASYVASNRALVGLARSIVGEYSHRSITANTCAGRVLTNRSTGRAHESLRFERIPILMAGRPADIARVVVFPHARGLRLHQWSDDRRERRGARSRMSAQSPSP